MLSLITTTEAAEKIAENVKAVRLSKRLTQQGLAERAGVPLPTYRQFERTGKIFLPSFLKIVNVLGLLDKVLEATNPKGDSFTTIDQVLEAQKSHQPKRGNRR